MTDDRTHKGTPASRRAVRPGLLSLLKSLLSRRAWLGSLSLLACCLSCALLAQSANGQQRVRRQPTGQQVKSGINKNNNQLEASSAGTLKGLVQWETENPSGGEKLYQPATPVKVTVVEVPASRVPPGPQAQGSRNSYAAITDAAGVYLISLPPGTYKVNYQEPFNQMHGWSLPDAAYYTQHNTVTVESGLTSIFNFNVCSQKSLQEGFQCHPALNANQQGEVRLPQKVAINKVPQKLNDTGILKGHVDWFCQNCPFQPELVPAKGVRITVKGIAAITDEKGNFVLYLTPGTYRVNYEETLNWDYGHWIFLKPLPGMVTIPRVNETVYLNFKVCANSCTSY